MEYRIAEKIWEERLGNHRAVITVSSPGGKAAAFSVPWRRRDEKPEAKGLIITDRTGRQVPDLHRISVNRERAEILFELLPDTDEYFLYYLPFKTQSTHGYYNKDYLNREAPMKKSKLRALGIMPGMENSLKKCLESGKVVAAHVEVLESRTAFDSFYPMELPLQEEEKARFFGKHKDDWLAVVEKREYPVRMQHHIPLRWLERERLDGIQGEARRNEYYAFQIAVYSTGKDLKNIRIRPVNTGSFTADDFCCYNTDGVDIEGRPFSIQVDVPAGEIRPLWMGLDIKRDCPRGIQSLELDVMADDMATRRIVLELEIGNDILEDRGDSQPELFSRIRWMNSTIGLDNGVIAPYSPLALRDKGIELTGKKVSLYGTGLPSQISGESSLLASPVSFSVKTGTKGAPSQETFHFDTVEEGLITLSGTSSSQDITMNLKGSCEPDGTLSYEVELQALKDVKFENIKLDIPLRKEAGEYAMGMGLPGGLAPRSFTSRWKGPWNSLWVGNSKIGLHCTFLGSSYEGPLQNLYHPEPPPSWYNNGRGRIELRRRNNALSITAGTGKGHLKSGEKRIFRFRLLVTPVRPLDTKAQFRDRYFHNPKPEDSAVEGKCKVANIHHASDVNPYINYPFLRNDNLIKRIGEYRDLGMKTKIYYTVRELTNRVCELPFLLSLGDEVLSRTPRKGFHFNWAKGYPWLREHIDGGYGAEWYAPLEDGTVDAALLTNGESRWYNYYLEGLNWMVKNLGIDGLYLDDVSYDRRILKRMRRILNQKEGTMLDLHSNTGFSKGPAVQYTGFFPYLNKLWFGESFAYDRMKADQWFVRSSGIPFGHMADMLQGGGNRWRGMVYGMTVRLPWTSDKNKADPRPVWKVWDDFGIEEAEMIGYWEKNCPVTTGRNSIKATVYRKKNKTMVALASWSPLPRSVRLRINWEALGIRAENARLTFPYIREYQERRTLVGSDSFKVPPKKGYLIVIEEK